MLPPIGLSSATNSQDINAQVAVLRSQMVTLRDAMEEELESISYYQLDPDLRSRIDTGSNALQFTDQNAEALIATLNTNYITAQEVKATYATITSLETVKRNYLMKEELTASLIASKFTSEAKPKLPYVEIETLVVNGQTYGPITIDGKTVLGVVP